MAVPTSELQKINPSSIIEMFELELVTAIHGSNTVYRFHNGVSEYNNGNIVWNGNSYTRMPITADGFDYNGKQLPRPTLSVSNIDGTITSLLLTLPQGLEGAKVTRLRTLERYIDEENFDPGWFLLEDGNALLLESDSYIKLEGIANPHGTPDPTALFPSEVFSILRKSAENREVVEFELAAAFDLDGVRIPKRQILPGDFPGIGTFYS